MLKTRSSSGLLSFALSLGLSACNHVFYFPDNNSYRDVSAYPFLTKVLSIARPSHPPLSAWLMNDGPESKGLILHFHGNAQNLTAHADFSAWLAQAGYTVLIFDYSGYGLTKGKPTQEQLIADSVDVMHWIDANDHWRSKGLPFIIFAQSLGGAVATTTLGENPDLAAKVDLLIVESSFDSYRQVAFQKLKSNPVKWILSPLALGLIADYRNPSDAVKQLAMPKIFVHGNGDEVVPFECGKQLYLAAIPPKEFWEIPFGNHTEAFVPGSPYRQQLLDRIQGLTSSRRN